MLDLTETTVYTCQKQQDDTNRCKFFLWDSDAKPREERALLNNSRSEPETTRTAPNTPSRLKRAASPPPSYSVDKSRTDPSNKRGRSLLDDDEDDYGLEDDPTFDEELRVMADVETPRKSAKTETFMTPRRKLPWDTLLDGMPTPGTIGRSGSEVQTRLPFVRFGAADDTPSKSKQSNDSSQTLSSPSPPYVTPTPTRFKDVGTPRLEDSLIEDVSKLLKEEKVHLSSKVATALKTVLEKHSRKAEGNYRSNEVLRLQLRAQEAKNMELTLRNNTLQAELEAAKATVEHLKWEKENDVNS